MDNWRAQSLPHGLQDLSQELEEGSRVRRHKELNLVPVACPEILRVERVERPGQGRERAHSGAKLQLTSQERGALRRQLPTFWRVRGERGGEPKHLELKSCYWYWREASLKDSLTIAGV